MIELNDGNFKLVLPTKETLIVKYEAGWCSPCKKLSPIFEKISENLKTRATFAKLDIDQGPETAIDQNIEQIPTIVIYKNGDRKASLTGLHNQTNIETWISTNI